MYCTVLSVPPPFYTNTPLFSRSKHQGCFPPLFYIIIFIFLLLKFPCVYNIIVHIIIHSHGYSQPFPALGIKISFTVFSKYISKFGWALWPALLYIFLRRDFLSQGHDRVVTIKSRGVVIWQQHIHPSTLHSSWEVGWQDSSCLRAS